MIFGRGDAQELGRQAELLACEQLQRQGMRPLARNWRCRRGELDLVMLDGDTVVFVEVRRRRHEAWGGALESVDARKRQRLTAARTLSATGSPLVPVPLPVRRNRGATFRG